MCCVSINIKQDQGRGAKVRSKQITEERPAILVVADDANMLWVASAVLNGNGYRVLVTTNAANAIQLLGSRQPVISGVVIRADIADSSMIELSCLTKGINVHFMSGVVEDTIVRLKLPDLRRHSDVQTASRSLAMTE